MRLRGARRTVAWIAVFAALCGYAAWEGVRFYSHHWSMDLYHPWGFNLAQASLPGANPYAETRRFGEFLDAQALASGSDALRWVRDFWEWRSPNKIEPTGTPFYYAVHAFLPADFDRAHLLYTVAQYLAAGLAAFLLVRLRGARSLPALCAAALVVATFNPFVQDLRVANVNSFQLLFIAALLWVSVKRWYEAHPAVDRLYLAALAVFLVFKPNTMFIVAGLALHYALARGPRRFATGAAIAAVLAFLAAACGAWFFGGPHAWTDWVAYTQGANGGTLMYSANKGNVALSVMLAEQSMAYGAVGYGLLIGLGLAVAVVAALSNLGRRPERLAPGLRDLFADPWSAASLGVLFTIAMSPLMWPHYFMFALIPMAWLLRTDGRWDAATGWAIASYLLFSRLVLGPLTAANLVGVVYSVMFFAWVPLVPALLSRIATPTGDRPPVPFGGTTKGVCPRS
jgi:hypothetical protein